MNILGGCVIISQSRVCCTGIKLLIKSSEFSQSKETECTAFWLDNENLFCLKSSLAQCCAELQGNQLCELTTSLLLNS